MLHLLVFQRREGGIIPVAEKVQRESKKAGAGEHPDAPSQFQKDEVVTRDSPGTDALKPVLAGMAMVFFGIFFLLYNVIDLSGSWLQDWWPLVVIVLGVYLIYNSVMASANGSENDGFWVRLGRQVKVVYETLQDRLDHGEKVCSELRHFEEIRVVHSPDYSAQEVEKRLRRFLEVGYSKHTRWLVIDGILSILGGVLMPLPGPNVFFFYPAARTFGHYLARSGAQRASQSQLEFVSDPLVGQVEKGLAESAAVGAEIANLEVKYNVEKLEQLLIRLSQHESRSV